MAPDSPLKYLKYIPCEHDKNYHLCCILTSMTQILGHNQEVPFENCLDYIMGARVTGPERGIFWHLQPQTGFIYALI